MALTITFLKDVKEQPMVTYGVRLFLTADRRVVEEGDPDALQLLAGENAQIPLAVAREFNLVDEDGKPGKGLPQSVLERITGNRTMVNAEGIAVDPVDGTPVLVRGEEVVVPQADMPNIALDEPRLISPEEAAQDTVGLREDDTETVRAEDTPLGKAEEEANEGKAQSRPAETKAQTKPAETKSASAPKK